MKFWKKRVSFLLIMSILLSLCNVNVSADELTELERQLSAYKCGNSIAVDEDGYLGIPSEISLYYDKSKGNTIPGIDGTPVILYVINTNTKRIGTGSDAEIVGDMLGKGYIVAVLDYFNNEKAVSPALEWSVQSIRSKLINGNYFDGNIISSGKYNETFVVPSGYNVSLNNVFWEIDKHSTDGTLEKIVDIWNTDFREAKGKTVIKWVDEDGNRKSTQQGLDGSLPVWLDESGKEDTDGSYIKVMHTKAEDISDCVKADGTLIDLNLYMHIIYPTNPEEEVPVMCLASSSSHLASSGATLDRPQLNGFTFNGYAGVIYDYCYVPMQRDDHYGLFSGDNTGEAVKGDHVSYTLYFYNNINIDTAAMRYLRYLSLTDENFKLKADAIGVYGNSKGGWMTPLGEEDPLKYANIRYYKGHHGETRYEAGKTQTYGNIDGGEEQPWKEINGKVIDSGADLIYASCGGNDAYITDNHAPTYISCNTGDSTYYSTSNEFVNLCRTHNVPALWFECDIGHNLVYGKDRNYGVDTYSAFFDFTGYYLKNDATKVVYTYPASSQVNVATTESVILKFTGPVSLNEIEKVTVKSSNNTNAIGVWSGAYGDTEWTFIPDSSLLAGEKYTVTVPASLAGKNEKAVGTDYIYSFVTEKEVCNDAISSVSTEAGNYIVFDASDVSADFNVNKKLVRFFVENNAANTAKIYPVISYNAASPDESVIGEVLGEKLLKGAGAYEFDVTDYVNKLNPGQEAMFVIKTEKAPEVKEIFNASLNSTSTLGGTKPGTYARGTVANAPDGTMAYKVKMVTNVKEDGTPQFNDAEVYGNPAAAVSNSSCIGKIDEDDYGRQFKVSFKVYDEISRQLQVYLQSCTNSSNETADYDMNIYNIRTNANKWTDVEFDYTVYDADYGKSGSHYKTLNVMAESNGNLESAMYFSDLRVTETVTDMQISEVQFVYATDDDVADKNAESEKIFAVFSENEKVFEHNSWADVIANYKEGQVIKLQDNYTVTDDVCIELSGSMNIDLNGYKIISDNASNSPFSVSEDASVTIGNGYMYLKDMPLTSYTASGNTTANIDFDSVEFRLREGSELDSIFVGEATINGAQGEANISFDSCKFKFDTQMLNIGNNLKKTVIFYSGNSDFKLNYKIKGGELNLTDSKKLSLYSPVNTAEFAKDTDGDYPVLNMPVNETVFGDVIKITEGFAVYKAAEVGEYFTKYIIEKDPLSTPYGLIPEEYASAEEYPFAVFKADDSFLGAYSSYGLSGKGGALHAARYEDGSTIYVRRDYSYDDTDYSNMSFHTNFTIDLAGHTFTCSKHMLNAYGRHATTTGITVKNGTILTSGKNPFANVSFKTNADKIYNITFENVTFGLLEGSTVTGLINYGSSDVTGSANIVFDDCVFDLRTNAPSVDYTLFRTGDPNGMITAKVTVNGGKILANSLDNITMYSLRNDKSSVIFGNGSDGNGIILEVANNTDVTSVTLPLENGKGMFERISSDDTYSVYELVKSNLTTPYGDIPVQYKSAEEYPFAVFKGDGSFEGAYSLYGLGGKGGALHAARSAGKDAVVYLRRDYTFTDSSYANLTFHESLTIDLGGHTFNCTDYMINLYGRHDTTTNIIVKNGSIRTNSNKAPVNSSFRNSDKKIFNVTFENIIFGLNESSAAKDILSYNGGNTGAINIIFNDCVFDLKTNAPAEYTLFRAGNPDGTTTATINVNGGRIVADSLDKITLYNVRNTSSSVMFGSGSDEKGISIELSSTATMNVGLIPYQNGTGYFEKVSSNDATAVYELKECNLTTPYGDIPAQYASANDYPFAVFKSDGSFEGAYLLYTGTTDNRGALHAARFAGEGAVVYLRRDYVYSDTSGYNNLTFHTDTLLDLGGHTLTCNRYMLDLYGRHTTTSQLTVKNGNVVAGTAKAFAQVHFSHNSGKVFNVTFENVNFGLVENSSAKELINYYSDNAYTGSVNFVFNNCGFDILTNKPANGFTLFGAGDAGGNITATMTVNGGKIVADELNNVSFISVKGNEDNSIKMGKFDGNYPELILSNGSAPSDGIATSENGISYFGKYSTDGAVTVYRLGKKNGTVVIPYDKITEIIGYNPDTFTATVKPAETGKFIVVFAKYDGSTLENVDIVEYEFVKNQSADVVQLDTSFALEVGDMVMIWRDINECIPVCEMFSVK